MFQVRVYAQENTCTKKIYWICRVLLAVKSQTHPLQVAVAHRHYAVLNTCATGQLPRCCSKILIALLQTNSSKAELVPQVCLVTCAQQSLTQKYNCIPDRHPQGTTSLAPAHNILQNWTHYSEANIGTWLGQYADMLAYACSACLCMYSYSWCTLTWACTRMMPNLSGQ